MVFIRGDVGAVEYAKRRFKRPAAGKEFALIFSVRVAGFAATEMKDVFTACEIRGSGRRYK